MITAYHRPGNIEAAISLIGRSSPRTLPLGGGTLLSNFKDGQIEVVDLQDLGLNKIQIRGTQLEIGATAKLQELIDSAIIPPGLKTALKLEAPLNIRNSATIAGTLVSSDGRSTLTTALLALDAKVSIIDVKPQKGNLQPSVNNLGEYLPLKPFGLIVRISIPVHTKFSFDYVSRTPADKPIACVALNQWSSGRTRLSLGGFGKTPLLAMDGNDPSAIDLAARNAFHDANDEWASSEYRMETAAILAKRCLVTIKSQS